MQIDRGSFLLGLVLGLALAAITLSGFVILAPRGGSADAAAASPTATATLPGRTVPTATATPAPTATATPQPTATAQPTPTPTVVPLSYETLDVPPRRFVLVEIPAASGHTLEATVRIDSDIDVTLFAPNGEPVEGPVRVREAATFRHQSDSGGNWVLKLDNSYSWISSKQVLLQYRVLPPR